MGPNEVSMTITGCMGSDLVTAGLASLAAAVVAPSWPLRGRDRMEAVPTSLLLSVFDPHPGAVKRAPRTKDATTIATQPLFLRTITEFTHCFGLLAQHFPLAFSHGRGANVHVPE